MGKLLPPEDRERNLRIIEDGITKEFWKVIKNSLAYQVQEKTIECSRLLFEGKTEEAKKLSIECKVMRDIIDEPQKIIRHNKPLFDQFIVKFCDSCGNLIKKFKPKEVTKNA